MDFNWIKSIITNSLIYIVFMVFFYILYAKYRPKNEPSANTVVLLYSLLVNIISLGIVMILSNPDIDENLWSFTLFNIPAVLAVPMSAFGVLFVPVLVFVFLPLVLVFHAIRMDIYIGIIGLSFAICFLVSGGFQYYVITWGFTHGWKELKKKIGENRNRILIIVLACVILSFFGVASWIKMHDVLEAVYLEKRQEIKYWR